MLSKISYLALAPILLLMAACGSVSGLLDPAPTPTQSASTGMLPDSASQSRKVIICIDRSTSYRSTSDVIRAVADVLPSLMTPDNRWFIQLRWIAENSYQPEAHITNVTVPPLPPAPPEPALDTNPFARHERDRQQREYETAKEAYERQTAEIRTQVQQEADQVRELTWAPAQGSDIWGCIQKAGELLRGGGEGWLLIASDLERYGPQQRAGLSLSGIHVRVVFWQADIATQGEQIQQDWRAWLVDLGAAEVEFYDPSEGLEPVLQEWLGN